MKRSKHTYLALAALLVVSLLVLSACNRVDSTEDPLSAYQAGSVTPAPTQTPEPVRPDPTPGPTVTAYTFSRLEYGDENEEVRRLQNRLIELGYMEPGSADGKYGDTTKAAVKAFQGALGLSKTGIANINLQQKLFLANAPVHVAVTPTPMITPVVTKAPAQAATPAPTKAPKPTEEGITELSKGAYGEKVRVLQNRLIALGYLTGTADGSYGTQTVNAVKRFQAAIGMNPTGIATTYLQEVLFSSGAPAAPTPVPTATPVPAPTAKPTPTRAPEDYTNLRYGQYNSSVYAMQRRLAELGYFTSKADGDYGQLTVEAVEKFQKAIGMEVDGKTATGYLQQKLYSDSAPVYVAPTAAPTTLYRHLVGGDSGPEVKRLQTRLKELGYFDGELGGNYLSKTTAAVKKFQAASGFDVTGEATVELQQYLFSSDAPRASATTVPVQPTPRPTQRPSQQATQKPSATAYRYRQLAYGDSGSPVKVLQNRLKELGYFTGNAAGNYREQTVEAVKKFQDAAGFDVTGVATVELQEYLFSADAPRYSPKAEPQVTLRPTQSPSGYVELSYGNSGNRVKKLQSRLKELGYFTGNVAGNYLEKTQTAVAAFQRAAGLTANGVASVQTQELLFSDRAPAAGSSGNQQENTQQGQYASLGPGATGTAVKKLQARLIDLGYMSGTPDGNYGARTVEAVKKFQKALGMSATGTATGYLQEQLFSADAPSVGSSGTSDDTYIELRPDDECEEVRNLQKRLYLLGFYRRYDAWTEEEGGFYDAETRQAVRDFQLAAGYSDREANGIATVELQELLFSEEAVNFAPMDMPQ